MTLTSYQYREALSITERAIVHVRNGTTDWAEGVARIPVAEYADEALWQKEMDVVLKRLPLMLALTCEMRDPGDYKTLQLLDVPVLMVRGQDGTARAFINSCSHRGAAVVNEPHGRCVRFRCPYHAWTYNDRGELVGISASKEFSDVGEIVRAEHGLRELPCEERCGMIFVCLTPGLALDLEYYLGQMLTELASFKLETWSVYRQEKLECCNWKLAHDGYVESYHVPYLHSKSLSKFGGPTQVLFDAFGPKEFGPHQRMAASVPGIAAMVDRPKSEWKVDETFLAERSIFPNTLTALSVSGGSIMQLIPIAPDRSITIVHFVVPNMPETESARAKVDAMVALVVTALRDEDYHVGYSIQRALKSGAKKDFMFGRNEVGPQRWHRSLKFYLEQNFY